MRFVFDECGMIVFMIAAMLPGIGCYRNEILRGNLPAYKNTYNFPWICSVTRSRAFVSTCTIIQTTFVVVAVDSLNHTEALSKYHYQDVGNLRIQAGMIHFDQNLPNPNFYQVRTPIKLYVPNVTDPAKPMDFNFVVNPESLDTIAADVYGFALNVGLLEFAEPLAWWAGVLPIPHFPTGTTEQQMKESVGEFRLQNERNLLTQIRCIVASWQKYSNSLITTEVIYIPEEACGEAYCNHDRGACLKFPKYEYLICYKSLAFMDMCPADKGAALYCENFNNQVIGILTTANNCGSKNLPSVYTSIEYVARFYRKVTGRRLEPGPNTDVYTTTTAPASTLDYYNYL